MAGARKKALVATIPRIASLVSEPGSSEGESDAVDERQPLSTSPGPWNAAMDVTRLPPQDVRQSDFIEEVGRQLGIREIQGKLVQIDHRLTTTDLRLDLLEVELDARFDAVRKMMQGLLASSRAEEAAVEDKEEAAVVEKEADDEVITTSKEEEVAEEAVSKEEVVASEDEEEVAAENKEVVKERNDEAQLPILIPDAYFNPFLTLCNKQGSKNERNLLLVAFLQLSEYCPPGVCKNALKRLGLQFVVEMGMIMVVGDEMLLPLPRPHPKPPPESPPRT